VNCSGGHDAAVFTGNIPASCFGSSRSVLAFACLLYGLAQFSKASITRNAPMHLGNKNLLFVGTQHAARRRAFGGASEALL
jgi:hypothetical protein